MTDGRWDGPSGSCNSWNPCCWHWANARAELPSPSHLVLGEQITPACQRQFGSTIVDMKHEDYFFPRRIRDNVQNPHSKKATRQSQKAFPGARDLHVLIISDKKDHPPRSAHTDGDGSSNGAHFGLPRTFGGNASG